MSSLFSLHPSTGRLPALDAWGDAETSQTVRAARRETSWVVVPRLAVPGCCGLAGSLCPMSTTAARQVPVPPGYHHGSSPFHLTARRTVCRRPVFASNGKTCGDGSSAPKRNDRQLVRARQQLGSRRQSVHREPGVVEAGVFGSGDFAALHTAGAILPNVGIDPANGGKSLVRVVFHQIGRDLERGQLIRGKLTSVVQGVVACSQPSRQTAVASVGSNAYARRFEAEASAGSRSSCRTMALMYHQHFCLARAPTEREPRAASHPEASRGWRRTAIGILGRTQQELRSSLRSAGDLHETEVHMHRYLPPILPWPDAENVKCDVHGNPLNLERIGNCILSCCGDLDRVGLELE